MLKWTNYSEIAQALDEKFNAAIFTQEQIQYILYTDLLQKIMGLDSFSDEESKCSEKHLENIQQHWLDEREI